MRKGLSLLLALCVMAVAVLLTAPRAQAAQAQHDHCVCGGSAVGVHDHTCDAVEWKPLSSVVSLTAVDWKDVPSGNYYLDADVQVTSVTDSNAIGQITQNADGTYCLTEARTISLCLNGHSISTSKDRVFKGVYMDCVLNICDCSGRQVNGQWQWDGTITAGNSDSGGILYTYANSLVNIYGGNFAAKAGKVTKHGGGLFYVAQDRSVSTTGTSSAEYASTMNIYNGNFYGGSAEKNGGNICVAHRSRLYVYGGYIHDGTAAVVNGEGVHGNIHSGGGATLFIGENAQIYGGYPEVAKLVTQGMQSQEYTLADAVKNYQQGSVIRLYRDLETDLVIEQQVLLDLNGHTLRGLTAGAGLTCYDSSDAAGLLSCTGTVRAAKGYAAIHTENGIVFHRYQIGITHLSIDPAKVAIGYKAKITGQAVLEQAEEFGLELWLQGGTHRRYSKPITDGEISLRVKNILTQTNTDAQNMLHADTPVYAFAYAVLSDGTRICGDTVAYSLKDMLHAADDCYSQFDAAQQAALQTMAGTYSRIMMTWDVENFHHADGGMWTEVSQAKFLQLGTYKSNLGYYEMKGGSYVLTEDVVLGHKTYAIPTGVTLNLCLNGHTITGGTKRMFRIYGELNLCDCHSHGDQEGKLIGNMEGGHGSVFYTYYGSTFNLYGGNLTANKATLSSGIGAVSHEAKDTKPDIRSGIMNMYGGRIYGGEASGNGGLVRLFHGSTFNLYGGELYDGKAGGVGGAIDIGSDCQANLLGGKIYQCSDKNGYALELTSASVCFGGDVQVDQLYIPYLKHLQIENMSPNARLHVVSDVHGFLADDPALADCFVLEEGYEAANIAGKLVAVKTGTVDVSANTGFRVGYSSLCINPAQATDIPLSGFGNSADRTSTEIADDLYVTATALTDEGGQTLLLLTCDLQRPQEAITNVIREHISMATGVPVEHILINASHSHSTPDLYSSNPLIKDYKILLYDRFTQAAVGAMANRVPATVQVANTDAVKTQSGKYFNFSRHYSYYSGSVKHYFGDNFGTVPSTAAEKRTVAHVTEGDHSMQLIRFVRQGEKDVLWCNFAAHPTMTGGGDKTVISSDFVGPLRNTVQSGGNCHFVYVQGAAGNMNPVSRIDAEMDNAHDVRTEYQAYGQALGQATLQLLQQAREVPAGQLQTRQYIYDATVEKPDEEEMARVNAYYEAVKLDPATKPQDYGFTSTYHVGAVNAKHDLNDQEKLELHVFTIGNSLAFYSLPGELWSDAAQEVKNASPFETTFTVGYCNGDWKYFVYAEAAEVYENYEYFYCRFTQPETTRQMVAWWKSQLAALYG